MAVNNTWHFFVLSLDVWSLLRYRDAMQSQKPCHRSDPHRNGVLTLTNPKQRADGRDGHLSREPTDGGNNTKLLKNKNKNRWTTACFWTYFWNHSQLRMHSGFFYFLSLFLSLSSSPTSKGRSPMIKCLHRISALEKQMPSKSKFPRSFTLSSLFASIIKNIIKQSCYDPRKIATNVDMQAIMHVLWGKNFAAVTQRIVWHNLQMYVN